ncbi:unnamed protein product [Staurois parvus]|uniref:Uncharacterized protein n=1 Tax=Staurois parvus TaxID=386267 RepID=A0ABN9EN72_9NEOB|nr:unnamed protein product [Staurois parvus]
MAPQHTKAMFLCCSTFAIHNNALLFIAVCTCKSVRGGLTTHAAPGQ